MDHATDIQGIKKFVLDYIEMYGADHPSAKLPTSIDEMEVVAGDCFKGLYSDCGLNLIRSLDLLS